MKKLTVKKIIAHMEAVVKNLDFDETCDEKDNHQIWIRLKNNSNILHIARVIKDFGGRTIIITAYKDNNSYVLIYHFAIEGIVINVELDVKDMQVDSITPILKSSDWAEREIKEMFAIKFKNHPNPQRLFLDESIKEGILSEYIPLSTAMNGAATCSMWEKINMQRQENEL